MNKNKHYRDVSPSTPAHAQPPAQTRQRRPTITTITARCSWDAQLHFAGGENDAGGASNIPKRPRCNKTRSEHEFCGPHSIRVACFTLKPFRQCSPLPILSCYACCRTSSMIHAVIPCTHRSPVAVRALLSTASPNLLSFRLLLQILIESGSTEDPPPY